MKVEKAKISDVPQIQALVNHFAAKDEMLPRSLSELYENIRDCFVVRDNDRVVACASLHVFWSDLAEIRSLAVAEGSRDKGLAAQLLKACLAEAEELGIGTIFCLTRSSSGIAEIGYDLPASGGSGKNGSPCTRLRYSAGRLSADGAPVFGDSFSSAASNGDISREPTSPAATVLVLINFLRFMIFLFYFLLFDYTHLTQSSGLRWPISK